MSLNVKDPEAHRLAQAIAKTTGETLTRAVTESLRERYPNCKHRIPGLARRQPASENHSPLHRGRGWAAARALTSRGG